MTRSWGLVLILSAALSYLMPAMGLRPFLILSWIDMWGSTTGWIIRIALICIGVWMMMRSSTNATTPSVVRSDDGSASSPQ